ITGRFKEIVSGLELTLDIDGLLGEIRQAIQQGATLDYVRSRGEFLNAQIIAEALGYEFVDAKDLVHFDENGDFDMKKSFIAISELSLRCKRVVIPGYYGAMPDGSIKTFDRGGSDTTGAVVAHGIGVDLYENWTDTAVLMVDPKIIPGAKVIRFMTHGELLELSDGGAKVFHRDAIAPALELGIPIRILNTNDPDDEGTLVVKERGKDEQHPYAVTGLSGKRFIIVTVGKRGMNQEVGFMWKVLATMAKFRINVQHFPGSNNTVSMVIEKDTVDMHALRLAIESVRIEHRPDMITRDDNIGVITVVGQGMVSSPGALATLTNVLSKNKINIRMFNQGALELMVTIGVDAERMEDAIRAIYRAFVKK
ncbi:MAG: ACT domain-containing protein, partial [Candidatus Moranbacteria bacterium]|nr:ACT domain-containing protein [Candidatus Moranbacteria bacterium]